MAILNYTTSIDAEKSIREISKCLVKHGAHKITTDYLGDIPSAVTFCLTIDDRLIAFSLPANHIGVMMAMKKDKTVPRSRCTPEQAQRVAWRIVKDWVEAQMAVIDAQLVEFLEVFLPYAIVHASGDTLYQELKATGNIKMLNSGQ